MNNNWKEKFKTIAFVGLGLMGGSLAKAIKRIISQEKLDIKIFACDINPHTIEQALEERIIDKAFSVEQIDTMLQDSDLTYICLYPTATLDFLKQHISFIKRDSIISDISGVKNHLLKDLPEQLKDVFIPGHPMAGSEREGYGHSSGNIFKSRNYILLTDSKTDKSKLQVFKSLITDIGFSRIIETDSKTHDHKIAFTSQLCHVIASALVESAEDTKVTEFGGGSFEDLTRIAMINAPLWTELFLSNKENLLLHIENFETQLNILKQLIKDEDYSGLENLLENVRAKRIVMNQLD